MKRLLWVSESPAVATGLGRVTRHLLPLLVQKTGWECAFVGFGEGNACDLAHQPYQVFAFPTPIALPDAVRFALRQFQPDIVVTFIDSWWVDWFPFVPERAGCKWLLYLNCDGQPLYPGWFASIRAADAVATTAAFGQRVVQQALPEVSVWVIPHGVDTQVFHPQPEARLPQYQNRFVVGCVARNMVRKQLPLLVRAFAAFRERVPEALLFLHTDPRDPEGWDLPDLLRRFGIAQDTTLPERFTVAEGLDDTSLARVYAQFDVFTLPTMGEGFGLPILEAMACGVPVAATDCSGVTELVSGCGRLIRPKAVVTGSYNVDQVLADGEHLEELLGELHRDVELRRALSEAGLQRAATRTWEHAAEALVQALQGL